MVEIPTALLVILAILGFIGLVHLIAYIFLFIGGVYGYLQNKKIDHEVEIKCPYFIESEDNKNE